MDLRVTPQPALSSTACLESTRAGAVTSSTPSACKECSAAAAAAAVALARGSSTLLASRVVVGACTCGTCRPS